MNLKDLSIFLLLFCSENLVAQNTESEGIDSLKKYSYFIYGTDKKGSMTGATCFFKKIKKQLYLISALHVFNGMNEDLTSDVNYPDILKVRIRNDKDNLEFYEIDISEIKKNIKPIHYYSSPDAYAYPVNIRKNVKIYSIENLKELDLPCDSIRGLKELITYGYPRDPKADEHALLRATPVMNKGELIYQYCFHPPTPVVNLEDTINYLIRNAGIDFGFSGAPVFIIHQNEAYFGGLILGGSDDKSALVVRPKYVLEKASSSKNRGQ